MSHQKLTIILVALHPNSNIPFSFPTPNLIPIDCTIKTEYLDISFLNIIDELLFKIIMRAETN